jgi:glycosyltransferase involved in cell wall biosynthesis
LLPSLAGGTAVSPYLLSQLPSNIPKLMLRGVVGADIIQSKSVSRKENIVLFSGTHVPSNGVAELINAWRQLEENDWKLHITGHGRLTEELKQMADQAPGVVFHGLVDRPELVRLMTSAKICINPHQLSRTPGNVFAFKIIEYLAAGGHVVTTPMGELEPELEKGITYMPDNSPATIAATLRTIIEQRSWERSAAREAAAAYGPESIANSLDTLLDSVAHPRLKKTDTKAG